MIVQLIRGLNMNTPITILKDGRNVSGTFLAPGIYPNWPKNLLVPKSAKILDELPAAAMIEERGTPILDLQAAQTAMIEKMTDPEVVEEDSKPKLMEPAVAKGGFPERADKGRGAK